MSLHNVATIHTKELFWVERPGDLFTHFSLIPLPGQSRETKFNAITRLFLIIIIILILLRVKKWALICVIGLLIIVVVYYNTKPSLDKNENTKDTKDDTLCSNSDMTSKESYRPPLPARRQRVNPPVVSAPTPPSLPSNTAVYNAREAVLRAEKDEEKKDKIEQTIPKNATPTVILRTGVTTPYSYKSRGRGREKKMTMKTDTSDETKEVKIEYRHRGESSQTHTCEQSGMMRKMDEQLEDDREREQILARINEESVTNATINIVYS